MNRPARILLVAVCLTAAPGCDWLDELTGPSVPNVAGTYTGPLTVEVTAGALTVAAAGSMTLAVEQDGDQVTMSGSLTIEGDTETIDAAPGTIDGAGLWTPADEASAGFAVDDDGCGGTVESTFRFSDNSLAVEISSASPQPTMECPNIALSATLARG